MCFVVMYAYMNTCTLQFSHVSIILQTSECILKYCALTCIICVYTYAIYMWFIASLNCMKVLSALLSIVLSPFALPSHLILLCLQVTFKNEKLVCFTTSISRFQCSLLSYFLFCFLSFFCKFISADFGCKLERNIISMQYFSIPFLCCLFLQLSNGGGAASIF